MPIEQVCALGGVILGPLAFWALYRLFTKSGKPKDTCPHQWGLWYQVNMMEQERQCQLCLRRHREFI